MQTYMKSYSPARFINLIVILMTILSQFGWVLGTAAADTGPDLKTGMVTINITPGNQWVQANGWTDEWTTGTEIILKIENSNFDEKYTSTAIIKPPFWDPNNFIDLVAFFDLNNQYTLLTGDVVTVSGGTTTVTVPITGFSVTEVNAETDTVSGWSDPNGAGVAVAANTPNGPVWRHVNADPNGDWSADFHATETEPGFDINLGDQGFALEYSHSTVGLLEYDWNVPDPNAQDLVTGMVNVNVTPGNQWVQANGITQDWSDGTSISLTINGTLLATQTMGPSDWNPNAIVAFFGLNDQPILQVGNVVTVSGGSTTVTVPITGFSVTDVDVETDTVSGWSDPNGAGVAVAANTPNGPVWRHVEANASGYWFADFHAIDGEQGNYDINPGDNGFALEYSHSTVGLLEYNWKAPDVVGVIDTFGGILDTINGDVTLDIPAGAISDELTFSITEGGSYQIVIDGEPTSVISSYSIFPEGTKFSSDASITFKWNDENDDGIVDGTGFLETNLLLIKDGIVYTPLCAINPDCDMVSNILTVKVKSLSLYELAFSLDQQPVNIDLSAPIEPVDIGVPVIANISSDTDQIMVELDWGDGTLSYDMVSDLTAELSHNYTAAGVYIISASVKNSVGETISTKSQFIVVYDPSAGFVTGGGWINSPAGAYKLEPSLTGIAAFGFVAKYMKGANVPDGNTEFQFKAGDLNFKSTSYDWLVVAGTTAKFKGVGTINGAEYYKFQIWAGDGSPDTFRIKIWSEVDGIEFIVYDNNITEQAIGGGSIVLHK